MGFRLSSETQTSAVVIHSRSRLSSAMPGKTTAPLSPRRSTSASSSGRTSPSPTSAKQTSSRRSVLTISSAASMSNGRFSLRDIRPTQSTNCLCPRRSSGRGSTGKKLRGSGEVTRTYTRSPSTPSRPLSSAAQGSLTVIVTSALRAARRSSATRTRWIRPRRWKIASNSSGAGSCRSKIRPAPRRRSGRASSGRKSGGLHAITAVTCSRHSLRTTRRVRTSAYMYSRTYPSAPRPCGGCRKRSTRTPSISSSSAGMRVGVRANHGHPVAGLGEGERLLAHAPVVRVGLVFDQEYDLPAVDRRGTSGRHAPGRASASAAPFSTSSFI